MSSKDIEYYMNLMHNDSCVCVLSVPGKIGEILYMTKLGIYEILLFVLLIKILNGRLKN